MNVCQSHWDKLRAAIDKRGLSALIADSGEKATANMARELTEGQSLDTYDPLMSAHWAIIGNGTTFLTEFGANPMLLMAGDQVEEQFRCVICYLNWLMDEHDKVCIEPNCQKPKGEAAHYEWMIDRAADDQVEYWKSLQP